MTDALAIFAYRETEYPQIPTVLFIPYPPSLRQCKKILFITTSCYLTKRLFNSWQGVLEILAVLSQTFIRPIALILSIRYEASKIRHFFSASLYIERARCGDAEPLLRQEFQRRENQFGPEHSHTIDMQDQLVSLYEAWHKPEEAEKWQAKLLETEAVELWKVTFFKTWKILRFIWWLDGRVDVIWVFHWGILCVPSFSSLSIEECHNILPCKRMSTLSHDTIQSPSTKPGTSRKRPKAKEWPAKLPQTEAVEEWQNASKVNFLQAEKHWIYMVTAWLQNDSTDIDFLHIESKKMLEIRPRTHFFI